MKDTNKSVNLTAANSANSSAHEAPTQTTELVMILDRSGSMSGLEADTIGGYNSMIAKQKETLGRVLVSTVLFDHETQVLYDRVPLDKVPVMTDRDYFTRGSTALLDAVGGAISHIRRVQKQMNPADVPEKTIFVITTDGYENASYEYSYAQVKQMVEAQKACGWEFIFLGANIDAIDVASRFGISADRAANYNSDHVGTALNYEVLSDVVCEMRISKARPTGAWKKRIDEDFEKRGKKGGQE